MERNLLSLICTLFFLIHFLFSPYPLNSVKKFKEEFLKLFIYFKIKKYKVEIDKDGDVFKIISAGLNAVSPENCLFIFSYKTYKFRGNERGMYVVKVSEGSRKIEIKCFDIYGKEENADSFLNYLTNIKEDATLFFGIKEEASINRNKKLCDFFKKIGANFSLINKYGYSYVFILKKRNAKFIPLFEKLSKDKIIFAKIKVK